MFPDLSKAADALNEARDLMKALILAVEQLNSSNEARHLELIATLKEIRNASL